MRSGCTWRVITLKGHEKGSKGQADLWKPDGKVPHDRNKRLRALWRETRCPPKREHHPENCYPPTRHCSRYWGPGKSWGSHPRSQTNWTSTQGERRTWKEDGVSGKASSRENTQESLLWLALTHPRQPPMADPHPKSQSGTRCVPGPSMLRAALEVSHGTSLVVQ